MRVNSGRGNARTACLQGFGAAFAAETRNLKELIVYIESELLCALLNHCFSGHSCNMQYLLHVVLHIPTEARRLCIQASTPQRLPRRNRSLVAAVRQVRSRARKACVCALVCERRLGKQSCACLLTRYRQKSSPENIR